MPVGDGKPVVLVTGMVVTVSSIAAESVVTESPAHWAPVSGALPIWGQPSLAKASLSSSAPPPHWGVNRAGLSETLPGATGQPSLMALSPSSSVALPHCSAVSGRVVTCGQPSLTNPSASSSSGRASPATHSNWSSDVPVTCGQPSLMNPSKSSSSGADSPLAQSVSAVSPAWGQPSLMAPSLSSSVALAQLAFSAVPAVLVGQPSLTAPSGGASSPSSMELRHSAPVSGLPMRGQPSLIRPSVSCAAVAG